MDMLESSYTIAVQYTQYVALSVHNNLQNQDSRISSDLPILLSPPLTCLSLIVLKRITNL